MTPSESQINSSIHESELKCYINSPHQTQKRKSLGRAARRRRAKLRAIEQAEESLWNESTTGTIQDGPSLVPADRDKIWPGVLERRKGSLEKSEEIKLVGQLGYLPGNAIRISARADCIASLQLAKGTPIVLQLYPLAIRDVYAGGKSDGRKFKGRRRGGPDSHRDGTETSGTEDTMSTTIEMPLLEPFPTMYWLTHPVLKTLISKLELGSTLNVRILEERLRSNKEALASMKRAHEAYGQERWELLTSTDLELIQSRKWQGALGCERGVAGIRKYERIKCLHTHAAHYLSGGKGSSDNVVGKWTIDAVFDLIRQREGVISSQENKEDHENRNSGN